MIFKRNLLESLAIISCGGTFICILLNYTTNISPIQGFWFPIYTLTIFYLSILISFKFIQWLLRLHKPIKYDLDDLIAKSPHFNVFLRLLPDTRRTRKQAEFQDYDTNELSMISTVLEKKLVSSWYMPYISQEISFPFACKQMLDQMIGKAFQPQYISPFILLYKKKKNYPQQTTLHLVTFGKLLKNLTNDTNELSVISTVLEKKLVSSWYMPYISQEISFPFACKQMLDQMIGKAFQICHKIETKDVYIDICMVLTSHLKEYRKALKRHEKFGSESVESLYKKTHPISNITKKISSTDHCTNILRIVLKELVPWELWDTPHSELLVRILSKKLDDFIASTLVDPAWLNDRLLTILERKVEIEQTTDKVEEKAKEIVKEEENIIPDISSKTIITTVAQVAVNETQKEAVQKSPKAEGVVDELPTINEHTENKSSPILRQRRGRQGRNEVKIYDRIIEGSVKTWETDMDLQCISLGQDLLASLDGEITLSRLWGQEGSPNPPRVSSPQPLWFGEDDMDLDLDSSPYKETKKEYSPKPGDALLKDIQSTVSQAKNKIGDLQDEAAGMMEGLLDFGIAGLKKGLRFTGLSDDSQSEKSPSHLKHLDRFGDRTPPDYRSKPIPDSKDSGITFPLQKEENGANSAHPLVKQQRVMSQDSVPSLPKPIIRGDFPPAPVSLSDSPEPQYEEVADLSTSIAKLRTLLQHRAQSQRTEDVWWESAEETRGRTQHHHSSKPVDTATLADEYDMNLDRNSSPGQTSNNMQRLDKLFQRTVTGVFNSIKTAVGAEGEEIPPVRQMHDWVYVYTSPEHTVGGAVAKLVGSRRAFTHVDAALDSLEGLKQAPSKTEPTPEDFEEWCACSGACWCAGWGLASSAQLTHSHVTHRIATLLFADLAESLISAWLDDLTTWLREQVFESFRQMSAQEPVKDQPVKKLREFDLEETTRAVLDRVPLLYVFGEETLVNSVKLAITSFSHKRVNRDVAFRALDLLALHFKNSAALRNPSFDGN